MLVLKSADHNIIVIMEAICECECKEHIALTF